MRSWLSTCCACVSLLGCSAPADDAWMPGGTSQASAGSANASAAGTGSAGASGRGLTTSQSTDSAAPGKVVTSTGGAGVGPTGSAGQRSGNGAAGSSTAVNINGAGSGGKAAGEGVGGQPAAAGSGGQTAGEGAAGRRAAAGSGGTSGASGTSSTRCELPEPPTDIADWVEESWDAQLGMNIKNRKAWNLDNVMLNKGALNLCVRWGATMAVPAEVRMNLASTVERWFNDWFKGLAGYGCFPYGDGIEVKITGWAVRPGRESLLEGVDPSIPVYTEQDGDGEPKCPDACSSFEHWDHDFSGCAKGADYHSDYWLWFDDALPGGGGAAAVGGDWGLRMPVATFLDAFSKPSDHIVEHEMGHGFGIQDYYDWRGAKPNGGSIMIVGSTQSESPTAADIWLLKRTWKEMKALRGW